MAQNGNVLAPAQPSSLEEALQKMHDRLFGGERRPSIEEIFQVIIDSSKDVFYIHRDEIIAIVDKLIQQFPDQADAAMEFVLRHVLPALLSRISEEQAREFIEAFLKESFTQIIKTGTVRGSLFIKPLGELVVKSLTNATVPTAAENVSKNIVEQGTKVLKCVQQSTKIPIKESVIKSTTNKVANGASNVAITHVSKEASTRVAKQSVQRISQHGVQAMRSGAQVADGASRAITEQVSKKASTTVTNQSVQQVSRHSAQVVKNSAMKSGALIADDATKVVTVQVSKETSMKVTTTTVKETLSETVESVATKSGVKGVTEAGLKNAAKAGCVQAGVSAVIGGVFLYSKMKNIQKERDNGDISQNEYKRERNGYVGEYVGDVISTGLVGAGICLAGLTGPAAVAAIGGGVILSFASGQLGGFIGRNI